jgi:predicted DNA-binding protein YlxM (UPF0122 family)
MNLKLVPVALSESVYAFLGAPEAPQSNIPVSVEQPASPVCMLVGHCRSFGLLEETVDDWSSMHMSMQGGSSQTSNRTEDDESCGDTWSDLGLSDTDSLEDACESEETDAGRRVVAASCKTPWLADDELPVVDLARLVEHCYDEASEDRADLCHTHSVATAGEGNVEASTSSKQEALELHGPASTNTLHGSGCQPGEAECRWGVRLRRTLSQHSDAYGLKDDLQNPVIVKVLDADLSMSETAEKLSNRQSQIHNSNEAFTQNSAKTEMASKFLEKMRARREIVDPQKVSGRGMHF